MEYFQDISLHIYYLNQYIHLHHKNIHIFYHLMKNNKNLDNHLKLFFYLQNNALIVDTQISIPLLDLLVLQHIHFYFLNKFLNIHY